MSDAALIVDQRVDSPLSATVVLRGELDLASDRQLTAAMRGVVEQLRPAAVCTVELDELMFMDSTGLRCLLGCASMAAAAGVTLRFERPTAQVLRVLELTNTGELLGVAYA